MKNAHTPRSNQERTASTRAALIQAARALFVEKGFGATSTPEIVDAAHITRGALYHHFADKQDLFRAVLAEEAATVAGEIEAAAPPSLTAAEALTAGAAAYLAAMTVPGRTRLLLIEGPAVLGSDEVRSLDDAHAARTLREGLRQAMSPGALHEMDPAILATLLSAAFDRAALAIDAGADPRAWEATLAALLDRVLAGPAAPRKTAGR